VFSSESAKIAVLEEFESFDKEKIAKSFGPNS
jgi:hypothetical protein